MFASAIVEKAKGNGSRIIERMLTASAAGLILTLAPLLVFLYFMGHNAYNFTNDVPWGLPVATYVFFVLTSTGLTFIASLAMVFGFSDFYPAAKRCVWLALATLVAGFAALALEIGSPFRMLWAMPTGLQYVSPMFWMGVFYSVYLVLLLLKFQRIDAGDWDSSLSRGLGMASFVSVVIAHSTLGLVFGMMAMRPLWYDPMMPVYFLVTAALSGAAFAVFFSYLSYGFRQENMPELLRALASGTSFAKVFATMIGVTILSILSRTITGLWSNLDGLQAFQYLVQSPLFYVEFLGLVIPFYLMVSEAHQRQARWQILSAVLVMASLFIGRYEFVVGGQIVPLFRGAWVQGFAEYTPSFAEWLLVGVACFLLLLLYSAGEKFIDLASERRHGERGSGVARRSNATALADAPAATPGH
jgi:molybdopterin-containing oxidoreductase family membrane subunit